MAFIKAAFFLVVGIVLAANAADIESKAAGGKVKLSFYVTSQCRDTKNFITKQLFPVYQELKEYLDVEFVPWGKSKRSADGKVSCQFGAKDCKANKIQSCALNLIEDQATQVSYMNCEFVNLAAVDEDYQCVMKAGVSEDDAVFCAETTLGDDLQSDAEAKTKTITMVFVPTIVLNDKYDAGVQSAAFSNFKKFVCSQLTEENPAACN